MTGAEQMRRCRAGKKQDKLRMIAVLDMETDPFDELHDTDIKPFAAELYSDQFGSIVIWENTYEKFLASLCQRIESLPGSFTIYCHNGGKFDYMFLVSKLRGLVKFKGRAIMSARLGAHELRDSLHLLPEKLAAWKKDSFDYSKMNRNRRGDFKAEILQYLHNDCLYLFDIVKSFVEEFGMKISIGAAAFSEMKKSYKVTNLKEREDSALRPFFFGGRVECLAGRGVFGNQPGKQPYKLFDVNAMYPDAMANALHPISNEYNWHRGSINENTVFLDISCRNYGALMKHAEPTTAEDIHEFLETGDQDIGRFHTTIHEFKIATKYNLISNIEIHWLIDCVEQTNFSNFITPMYYRRQKVKTEMSELDKAGKSQTRDYEELHKQNLFLKYLLNNAYGKFAQNPRKYKDYCYTDLYKKPDKDWFKFLKGADEKTIHAYSYPVERSEGGNQPGFAVWQRPNPGHRFNNVGTAASITGAARAKLLEALVTADDPIYCDTDSIICRALPNVPIDVALLGAWKIEQTFDEVIIAGKKTYACKVAGFSDGHDKRIKIRSKGTAGMTYDLMRRTLDGEIIPIRNKVPTFRKTGEQYYMTRRIRATAPETQSTFRSHKRG